MSSVPKSGGKGSGDAHRMHPGTGNQGQERLMQVLPRDTMGFISDPVLSCTCLKYTGFQLPENRLISQPQPGVEGGSSGWTGTGKDAKRGPSTSSGECMDKSPFQWGREVGHTWAETPRLPCLLHCPIGFTYKHKFKTKIIKHFTKAVAEHSTSSLGA